MKKKRSKEEINLMNQLYYSKRSMWKYTFVCITLTVAMAFVHNINYILVIVPFLISAFVSLIHEIGVVNEYNLKLAEFEES